MAMWALVAAASVSALGSLQQSAQAEATANYNAKVAANNAIQERAWAAVEADRQRSAAARQRAALTAATAASGVSIGSGSVLDVLSDDAIRAELDALTTVGQGESRARGFQSQGNQFRMEASNIRNSAFTSAIGAGMRGGGSTIAGRYLS